MIVRSLILLLAGGILGAASFHAYYLRQSPPDRCWWDHPFDKGLQAYCATPDASHGYASDARRDLDNLVGKISN